MDFKTSAQVAETLGISRTSLNTFLTRHPELRPVERLEPSGDLLWTEEEIQKVVDARSNKSKGGRPKKK